jgi:hypothetical protein
MARRWSPGYLPRIHDLGSILVTAQTPQGLFLWRRRHNWVWDHALSGAAQEDVCSWPNSADFSSARHGSYQGISGRQRDIDADNAV